MPTRVYLLAKKLGVSSKKLRERLGENGVKLKNHLSSLEENEVALAINLFKKDKDSLADSGDPKVVSKTKKKTKIKKNRVKTKSKKTVKAAAKIKIKPKRHRTPFDEKFDKVEMMLQEAETFGKKIREILQRRKKQAKRIQTALKAKHKTGKVKLKPKKSSGLLKEKDEISATPRQQTKLEKLKAHPAEKIDEIKKRLSKVKPVEPPKTVELPTKQEIKKTGGKTPPAKTGKKRRIITIDGRLRGPKPVITKPAAPLNRPKYPRHAKSHDTTKQEPGGFTSFKSKAPQEPIPEGKAKGHGKGRGRDHKSKTRFFPEKGNQQWKEKPSLTYSSRFKQKNKNREIVRPDKLDIPLPITVKEFSNCSGIRQSEIIKFFFMKKIMLKANSHLQEEAIEELGVEYDIDITIQKQTDLEEPLRKIEEQKDPEDKLVRRPPIVTFLGHVDHGKTSILDKIRHANVQQKEFGGITQHISAYRIDFENFAVTFVDTPGHAAFTQMRARGANITDIVVLVVAADDGPMPQTEEAISHALEADVAIIVAINKIDLPTANVLLTKQRLAELGIMPPEWGGNAEMVEVSAKTGKGLDDLIETIHLVGEVRDLKANPERDAYGVVLEAQSSGNRGIIVTIMIQNGTLHLGDYIVCGHSHGRIRGIWSTTTGKSLEEAAPATPVEIIGLSDVPEASNKFYVLSDPQLATSIAEHRLLRIREEERANREREAPTLEDFMDRLKKAAEEKELRIVLKGDVKGSIEAIEGQVLLLGTDEVKVKILRSGVGLISEGDVALAEASKGIVLGFNVSIDDRARSLAEKRGVHIRTYNVIYELLEEVRVGLEDRLAPVYEDAIKGHAEIRQIFSSSKVGNICGCFVTDGVIYRNSQIRLLRDNEVIFTGTIDSLRRNHDSVKEVKEGIECGIKLNKFESMQNGDIIECYRTIAKRRSL